MLDVWLYLAAKIVAIIVGDANIIKAAIDAGNACSAKPIESAATLDTRPHF